MARLEDPVIFTGMAELNADLKATAPAMLKALRLGLEKGAEPVKEEADRESNNPSNFSGMARAKIKPPPWSVQKIGQNTKEVYMVPTEKGARAKEDAARRRPKFATRMIERVYDPALEHNRPQILRQVNLTIDVVTKEF